MNNIVHLTDNNTQGTSIPRESIQDVLQISNIGRLQNAPDLLVFPHSFSEVKDGIGTLSILTLHDAQYNDGTHKFKSWKTKAKVEVSYDANTGIIQGVKNGETPSGTHVVGGNGSFRFYEKGDYVLKVTLDCLAGEKPIKHDCFIDVDTYMRQLKETKEWGRNLPYKKVNELLKEKVEVITYDMDKEPFERTFYPIGYDGNWITYLKDKLKNI